MTNTCNKLYTFFLQQVRLYNMLTLLILVIQVCLCDLCIYSYTHHHMEAKEINNKKVK